MPVAETVATRAAEAPRPRAARPVLELDRVTKRFGAMRAIREVSFPAEAGDFVAVVGPSGSGESAVLNLVSGLDAPSEGAVRPEGAPVTGPSRHVGFMLRKDLPPPWRTIRRNVEFGLEARAVSREERRERALRDLARCRLSDVADHDPRPLSGGMRQRAALARTRAIDPALVLLDEPFSALDAQTKPRLQTGFARTIHERGVTAVLITRDLMEAVAVADRIVVLSDRPGRVLEEITVDPPHRDDPLARRLPPRANEMLTHLFELPNLDDPGEDRPAGRNDREPRR